jgi:phosphoglycerol transferase MdoB-like AlkP superfamily enzyme
MIKRLRFLGAYLLFWVMLFETCRVLFLLYEWRKSSHLSAGLLAGSIASGIRMDLSAACYLTVIPLLIIASDGFVPSRVTKRLLEWFTIPLVVLVAILVVSDLGLFAAWGFRIDATPLLYMSTPGEAFASASSSPLTLLVLLLCAAATVGIVAFRRLVVPLHDDAPRRSVLQSAAVMTLIVPLFVGVRGGIQLAPINQSTVYFSGDEFANQAAINPAWNFFASVAYREPDRNDYKFTDDRSALRVVDSLLGVSLSLASGTSRSLLRVRRPNIVLIIWEGLTAKVVGPLGGRTDVTPNFGRLTHEGILFDGIYASGNRTPKGLPAVLSGFPSQPIQVVVKSWTKSAALPTLSGTLSRAGYRSAFYYGGELEFANIKTYLANGHYDRLVSKSDFNASDWNSKWGAHDHVVLGRVLDELETAQQPWLATVLTLSSHEPFDVPMKTVISGDDEEHQFLNSHVYADRSVADFIERARHQPWWDSTLVIITADHGNHYPEAPMMTEEAPEQYRIPMLWLGGALAVRDTVIHRIASQTDIVKTLLDQLGLSSSEYRWSKNFLTGAAPSSAYYAFKNGFGFVDPNGSYVFDNFSKRVTHQVGEVSAAAILAGRSFQQVTAQAYIDLGRPRKKQAPK